MWGQSTYRRQFACFSSSALALSSISNGGTTGAQALIMAGRLSDEKMLARRLLQRNGGSAMRLWGLGLSVVDSFFLGGRAATESPRKTRAMDVPEQVRMQFVWVESIGSRYGFHDRWTARLN